MGRTARVGFTIVITVCLIAIPWRDAFASESESIAPAASLGEPMVNLPTPRLVIPDTFIRAESRALEQATRPAASRSQSNFLIGVLAAGLILGGVALLSYGTTDSCRGGNLGSSSCDHDKVLGAVSISGGSLVLVYWALSR
jgi:hypothetical protein